MIEQFLAAAEVAGRHAVSCVPQLRAYATKWVRKAPLDAAPLSLDDLERAMTEAGVECGRDLMVHASWGGIPRLQAKPSELLGVLKGIVGSKATLVMPTHPVEKRRDGVLIYEVDRSPTRMGMLAETMRRAAGRSRSPVPIAPVSALGPAAEQYVRDYREESRLTPWGRGSPYWEIAERRGQVLVLGIDFVRTLTLMHTAFDVLLEENPIPDFYEPIDWLVVREGKEERWSLRQQRRYLDQHLATFAFRKVALESETISERVWHGVRIAVVDARRFLDWHLGVVKKTGLPYWGWRFRPR
jgi:aminoglycoside N3'-acetyltransferase